MLSPQSPRGHLGPRRHVPFDPNGRAALVEKGREPCLQGRLSKEKAGFQGMAAPQGPPVLTDDSAQQGNKT